ncbi:MAG: 5'/3'-nucleotidase SurE [bacterium]|nr:5'/3'-nucleotidase SurE [bacterium]
MKILLTNDDGYSAPGIQALYEVFSKHHTVYMIAPDRERSACSNAFTLRAEINVKKVEENLYAISGYPADCAIIGINGDIIPEVDMVVSGINHGPNIGDDMVYSGTVAGARTAFSLNKTGIAISLDCFGSSSDYFHDAAEFLISFIEEIRDEAAKKPMLFNINYPDLPKSEVKGVKYTTTGKRIYCDTYEKTITGSNEMVLLLRGDLDAVEINGSDITELTRGYISITPLTIDSTDYSYLNKKKNYG